MFEGVVARSGPWGGARLLRMAEGAVSTGDEVSSVATTKMCIFLSFILGHFGRTSNSMN